MRQITIPVQAVADSSGNAAITLPLEKTGEWRLVKVSLGTTGPAEWALRRSGLDVNYGRGRRVTLGPELLEPFDTLTVSMTGGPAGAAIGGTVVGVSGTEAEIVRQFQPAPNTIALDTLAPSQLLRQTASDSGAYSISDAALHTYTFPIPAGAQSFRMLGTFAAGAACSTFKVSGDFTAAAYAAFGDGSPKLYINHAFGIQASEVETDDTRRFVANDTILTVRMQLTSGSCTFVLMSFNGFGDIVSELGGNIGVFDSFPIIVRNSSTPAWWQRRPVDGNAVAANVTPGAASVTIPAAGVGVRNILNNALFTLDNRTAGPVVQGIRIWDGASGATLLWFSALQAAAGTVARDGAAPGTFLQGSANTVMTLDFSAGVVNVNESIVAGWYLSA